MDFQQTLTALGVRDDTLTPDEKKHLDEQGFLYLRNIFTVEQAAKMREAMDAIFAAENVVTSGETGLMQNKSTAFDVCVTHPRVLAAVWQVLRSDFKLVTVASRPNPPGKGQQGMHVDGDYAPPGTFLTCNSMWPLVDFTELNGATRVVPGSHRDGRKVDSEMSDIMAAHPQQIQLVAPVGNVIVFNGHLWHSAMQNNSDKPRANVTSFWCRKQMPADFRPMPSVLGPETAKRLPPAARGLFDPM
jgi:hypothetical protein